MDFLCGADTTDAQWQQMKVKRDKFGVPIVNSLQLEGIAEHFLSVISPKTLVDPASTPLIAILDELVQRKYCTFTFDEDLGQTADGKKCLGYYSMSRKHIAIDRALSPEDPRFSFTCAHEIGHFYLHGSLDPQVLNSDNSDEIRDSSQDILTFRIDGARPRTRVEWQANRFAAGILLPQSTLPSALDEVQKALGITRRGRIWLDHQPQNQRDYRQSLFRIAEKYSVSQTVVRYRLRETGLLQEDPSYMPRRIGETLEHILKELFDR